MLALRHVDCLLGTIDYTLRRASIRRLANAATLALITTPFSVHYARSIATRELNRLTALTYSPFKLIFVLG